jgi:hypothetical protein
MRIYLKIQEKLKRHTPYLNVTIAVNKSSEKKERLQRRRNKSKRDKLKRKKNFILKLRSPKKLKKHD